MNTHDETELAIHNLPSAISGVIKYPQFKSLEADIRLCLKMTKISGEPNCMALEGVTGAGKTTFAEMIVASYSRIETTDGSRIPVFYVGTPSPATTKGIVSKMLYALGDPAAYRGTQVALDARLIRLIQACSVKLVILDDFHHLIDSETQLVIRKVSDWLKVVIKESGVPVLVVGTLGKVEQILDANDQLSRLFAIRQTLTPFYWNILDENSIKSFWKFIDMVVEYRGYVLTNEISRPELVGRIYRATNGVVGNIINLLTFASLLAEEADSKVITLGDLAKSFDLRLYKHINRKSEKENARRPIINPFV